MNKDNKYQNKSDSDEAGLIWQAFTKNNTINSPQNLSNDIWKGIEQKRILKRKYIISTISAAASLLLFITINMSINKPQSIPEKEALLSEALTMFSNNEQTETKSTLLYEDELIEIYSQSN